MLAVVSAAHPFLHRGRRRRPLVVGHRGLPHLHQENSLAGFRRAAALGVPAVELDVVLTRDRRAIVFHDRDVARLTDGQGDVADLTWDQVSRLRLRRALPMGIGADGAPVVARYAREEPIALLAEVLAELRGKVAINIELKLGLPRWWQVEVAVVVAEEIAAAGVAGQVIVTSFDPRKLRAARRACAGLEVGFCYDDGMLEGARPLFDRLRPQAAPGATGRALLGRMLAADVAGRLLGSRAVGAEHTLIGAAAVERLHAAGVALGTHTLFPLGSTTGKPIDPRATTDAEAHRLADLGVDWIETDDAERLLTLLA